MILENKNKNIGLEAGFFLAGVIFVLNLIVPPFQNPDEPAHFGAILVSFQGEENRIEVEKGIIAFMDRHSWWRYVGMGRPVSLPEKLSDISFLMENYPLPDFRLRLNNLVFYHIMVAKMLKMVGGRDVSLSRAYFFCRLFSVNFFLMSLLILFFAFRKIFRYFYKAQVIQVIKAINPSFAIWGFIFAAFLPQFLLTSISVSPDAFSILLGSLFFLAAFGLILEGRPTLYIPIMAIPLVAGFFTDRSLFPFLAFAVIAYLFSFKKKNYRSIAVVAIFLLMLTIFFVYLLTLSFPLQMENSFNILRRAMHGAWAGIKQILSFSSFHRRFFLLLADSFLLCFGWMTFGVARSIYYIWRIFIILSLLGLTIYSGSILIKTIISWAKKRTEETSFREKNFAALKIILFSAACILIQMVSIFAYYGRSGYLPQGRYLFPLIIPIVFLFIVGFQALFGHWRQREGEIFLYIFLLLEFFFLNAVIWGTMVPVFHLVMKSPHPGI